MVDGIMVGVSANGRDHMARQEARAIQGAILLFS
jgi:hypothetical protein